MPACTFPILIPTLYNANIVWASTNQTKLTKILTKQKHVVRIIFDINKQTHARPLFKELNAFIPDSSPHIRAKDQNFNMPRGVFHLLST